jgi:hypothetical protein
LSEPLRTITLHGELGELRTSPGCGTIGSSTSTATEGSMTESPITIKDVLLLVQAAIVLGGGFFFAGRLGAKLDNLSSSIDGLRDSMQRHGYDLRDLSTRVVRLESTKDG